MSHLSLVFASKSQGLSGASVVRAERGFGMVEATPLHNPPFVRDGEASLRNDCTLPAGIASMEHWLDLNA